MVLTACDEQVEEDAERVKGELTYSPLDGLLIVGFEEVDVDEDVGELVSALATVTVTEVAQTPPFAFHTFTCTVWVPAEVETLVLKLDLPPNMVVAPLSSE